MICWDILVFVQANSFIDNRNKSYWQDISPLWFPDNAIM